MRFLIALIGLLIFQFGSSQNKISALTKLDLADFKTHKLPIIIKVNEDF